MELGITDGCILKVDDFLQNYELTLLVNQYVPKEREDPRFKIIKSDTNMKPMETLNGKIFKYS